MGYTTAVMPELTPTITILAVDVETTGLSPMRDRIVELAGVRWRDGREIDAFQQMVNPGRHMPHAAFRVHGISDVMLAGKPPISEVMPAFLDFFQADMLVAHNARFDLSFIREECVRLGLSAPVLPTHDTCAIARRILPDAGGFSLEAVKAALGIGYGQSHRALDDARDCLHIFLRLIGLGYTPSKTRPDISSREQAMLADILAAVATRRRVGLEYRDGRGRVTKREVLPLSWTEDDLVLEAHCFLRDEVRHFYLQRIRRVWVIEES